MIRIVAGIIGLVLLVSVSGCKNKEQPVERPQNLIPRQEMINILVDIHLIEASLKTNYNRKLHKDEYTRYYYNYLYDKYKISRENFDSSLAFYQQNIQSFDTLYADVITELSKIQGYGH